VLGLLAAPAAAAAGAWRPRAAAPAGTLFAALAFAAALAASLAARGEGVVLPWAPSLGASFAVKMDGLAALYSLLATGIGLVVLVYSAGYLPLHLEHQGRPASEGVGFYFFVLLFMGSMVGLAMAQDLILIFLFWDLTAIASYYLIGYDRHREESRASAMMSLLVTGITAVLLLVGALLLYASHGTFSVPELAGRVEPGALLASAGLLVLLAAFAKSAQAPFHFWLPRAMAAPTPVSAYLHSAAMVAAGVLLVGRLYPILAQSEALLAVMSAVGLLSIGVGGILALTRDTLKQLLAYSTVAQYGYVVFMYGLGGRYGAAGAAFYVIAHALAKSALFLSAGAVTEATGEDRLSRLGGLWSKMPLLAASSGLAAAGLAALPLTIGFFKDEFFFAAALERGALFGGLAVLSASVTLAYTWRFWSGIFLGRPAAEPGRVAGKLVWPVVLLGALVLFGGLLPGPFAALAGAAAASSLGEPAGAVQVAYHLDARPENLLALAAYALGAAIVVSRPAWEPAARLFARAGEAAGPERAYRVGLRLLNLLSDRGHELEVRDLRGRIAGILLPAGVLVGLGLLATPTVGVFRFGEVGADDLPLLIALAAAAGAALATCLTVRHLTLALVISSAGFSVALVYGFLGAPDVALVAVLVETILTLLLLATMRLIPPGVLRRGARISARQARLKAAVAVVAGMFALAVSWSTFSQPAIQRGAYERLIALTPEAHGKDVVTVTLADFRGLDTLGEITVVALALLGVATLLARGRLP